MTHFVRRSIKFSIVFGVVSGFVGSAVGDSWQELHQLTAFDKAAGDRYGSAVGISGNRAIVGSYLDDDAGLESGSAYLYDLDSGQSLFKLTAADAAAGDNFGESVAIRNNIAIVGAFLDDDAGLGSGSAYLFDVNTGQQRLKLTASDASALDFFGDAVALSGNFALVGAPLDDDAGSGSGSAYLFDVTTGQQLRKLTPLDGAASDRFGISVAIDGNIAVVGADRDSHVATQAGSAYVFDVTTGQQLFKLAASDAAANDWFGSSVAISGDRIIVGSDRDGSNDSGSAYLFDATTGVQLMKLTASDAGSNALFGHSVAISENLAVIGAPYANTAATGSAYVFDLTIGEETSKLVAPGTQASNWFGFSVAIDGLALIAGSPFHEGYSGDTGAAYVFRIVPEPEVHFLLVIGTGIWLTINSRAPSKERIVWQ
jgi:outer membrane protein assembly factor BamB